MTGTLPTAADSAGIAAGLTAVMLPLGDLAPHPENPRQDLGDLTELTASIAAHGVFEPLVVLTAEAESDARGLVAEAIRLQGEARAALQAAQAALTAARAMPSGTREQADARSAALTEAAERVALARDALEAARSLARRAGRAADRLAQVPDDLAEVYEAAYGFIARDGVMPRDGDWLTGTGPA
jgi:hypothetical protein